jgi:hypothetical protein
MHCKSLKLAIEILINVKKTNFIPQNEDILLLIQSCLLIDKIRVNADFR